MSPLRGLVTCLTVTLFHCTGGGHNDAGIDSSSADASDGIANDTLTSDASDSTVVTGDPLGTPCMPTAPYDPATCTMGLYCSPAMQGVCSRDCSRDSDCPAGAACVDSATTGAICLARCTVDSDCLVGVCNPVWHACATRDFASPPPPACTQHAPAARTMFGASQPVTTATSPGTWQFEPAAALTHDGTLVMVYTGGTGFGLHNVIGAATVGLDNAITDRGGLMDTRESHFDPWLASDSAGAVHLVAMGFNNTTQPTVHMEIAHRSTLDGITWTPAVAIDDAMHDCPGDVPDCLDKPMIAIGPDAAHPGIEALFALYTSDPAGGMRAVRSHDDGATWSMSTSVGPGTYGDVRVGGDGTVHVLFVDGSGNRFGSSSNHVTYVVSHDGGAVFTTAGAASAVGESVPFFFSNPQLAIDDVRHTIYATYAAGTPDGAWDIRLATSINGGSTWSRITVNNDAHCANHMIPNLVVDPATGNVHVIWVENRDGTGRLVYARCDAGGAACGANETVSDMPFADYHFVRQNPSWLGEYNALVLDSAHHRLHAVWTQTVNVAGVPTARVFHAVATP